MDWNNIGSVSDIISTIAIVGTLTYIAVQMRQARIADEAQGTVTAQDIFSRWRTSFVQNPELATIADKTNRAEPLTGREQLQYSTLFDDLFLGACVSFANSEQTGSIHDVEAEIEYITHVIDRNPSSIPEWHRIKKIISSISSRFVDAVDAYLAAERS